MLNHGSMAKKLATMLRLAIFKYYAALAHAALITTEVFKYFRKFLPLVCDCGRLQALHGPPHPTRNCECYGRSLYTALHGSDVSPWPWPWPWP